MQHVGELIGLGVALPLDGLRGGDEPPEGGLLLHDLNVCAGVGGGGHEAHGLQEIDSAAHAVQRAAAGELVAHGHEIDRVPGDVQGAHGLKNLPVLGRVEIRGHKSFKGEGGRAGILKHRAQHRSFGINAAGGQCGDDWIGHAGFHAGVPPFELNDGDQRRSTGPPSKSGLMPRPRLRGRRMIRINPGGVKAASCRGRGDEEWYASTPAE